MSEKIKEKIIVPSGIRYISEWEGFELNSVPHILDKKIPGCGFTEYCIRNDQNVILCSPRIILLENKEKQHEDEVLYVKCGMDTSLEVDKDITKNIPPRPAVDARTDEEKKKDAEENYKRLYSQVEEYYYNSCVSHRKACKLLVTYDSYQILQSILEKLGILKKFYTIVDEFQSIFTDSRFKSDTEMEFVEALKRVPENLCFVSATPMIDEYLDMLDEFKDLPYYELDWETEDPLRVSKPELKVRTLKSVVSAGCEIVEKYKSGNFDKAVLSDGSVVTSKEAVIYVNSVNNLVSIIKKSNLREDEVNILCARTPENIKKVKKSLKMEIGKVPLKGQPHKMFTLCTRTVYLGADFYSTNAMSYILSDANIETLAVDITLDLPQILGRQRLSENPWKNRATLLYKTLNSSKLRDKELFKEELEKKINTTNNLLSAYQTSATPAIKHSLAEKYQTSAKTENYKKDYVAVNTHDGADLKPVFNKLVMVSEKRAYDIQQLDYADRFTVFNQVSKLIDSGTRSKVINFLGDFEALDNFHDKMNLLCESGLSEEEISFILTQVPVSYKNYYLKLGPSRLYALGYNITYVKREYSDAINFDSDQLKLELCKYFEVGKVYSFSDAKEIIKIVYNSLGYNKTPRASDLEQYFEIKKKMITNKSTGKRDHCYEILKIKTL